MNWKSFFELSVIRENHEGNHPYFHSVLKVPDEFSMDELLMKEFEHLKIPHREKKFFNIHIRKILLRHHYFHSAEFDRIVNNFVERLSHEKDRHLTFSTSGGGIYLFLALGNYVIPELVNKKLICYTSDKPLFLNKFSVESPFELHFFYRPGAKSFLKNLPCLWQNTHFVDLSKVREA